MTPSAIRGSGSRSKPIRLEVLEAAVGDSVTQEAPTLEVRWLRRGVLPTSMTDWFSAFGGQIETRTDTYLVTGRVRGVSVKIRGGLRLDIKVSIGDRGVLDVPGYAHGRTQAWKKWSLPIPPLREADAESPDWVRVAKRRHISWFSIAHGVATARDPAALSGGATCAVELTEVINGKEAWWALGLEAAGAPDTLKRTLGATAALLFSSPPPDGLRLRMSDSMSYSEWLHTYDCGQS